MFFPLQYPADDSDDPVNIIQLVLTERISNLLVRSPHLALTVSLYASQPLLLRLKVEVAENFSHFQQWSLQQVLNITKYGGKSQYKSSLNLVKYDVTILRHG